jgi:hypothetical protein
VELHLHSSNTPSWRGARLKHRYNFTFVFNGKSEATEMRFPVSVAAYTLIYQNVNEAIIMGLQINNIRERISNCRDKW